MSRKFNFSAGPSTLPLEVLEQAKAEFVDFKGIGMSLIEASHRGKDYEQVHNESIALFTELLGIPKNYKVLYLGGGATLQFSMVPLNLMAQNKSCDFMVTGIWSKKAAADAKKVGKVNVVYDGAAEKFTSLPKGGLKFDPNAAYVHIASNETIHGVQFQQWPDTGKVPLVVDMSSDIMSRPVPVEKMGLIFAGAQKNLGPAGLTVVVIREDLLEIPNDLTAYLGYKTHATENSLYNTPPVFAIYIFKLVLEWAKKNGGLKGVTERNEGKAKLIYDAIDGCPGFYKGPVKKEDRSKMNIVFTLPSEALETELLDLAKKSGMVGLKGHRSIGGCRVSLYNAMPVEGAKALSELMKDFAKKKV